MRNPMGSAGVRLLVCAVSNGLPRYSRLPDPGPAGRRALADLDPVTVFGGGERRGAAATARKGLRLPCHTLCLAHSLQEEGQQQHGGPGPMPAGAGAAAVTAIFGIGEVVEGVGVDVVGAAVGTTALSIVPSNSTSSEPDVAGSPPAAVAATAPAPAGATASATPVLATPSTTATAATATPPVLVGPVLEGSCRGPGQEEDCCDSQGVRDTPPGTVATQETSFPIVSMWLGRQNSVYAGQFFTIVSVEILFTTAQSSLAGRAPHCWGSFVLLLMNLTRVVGMQLYPAWFDRHSEAQNLLWHVNRGYAKGVAGLLGWSYGGAPPLVYLGHLDWVIEGVLPTLCLQVCVFSIVCHTYTLCKKAIGSMSMGTPHPLPAGVCLYLKNIAEDPLAALFKIHFCPEGVVVAVT